MAMILPKGSILAFADITTPETKSELSEHNRGPVNVSAERIETSQRMANGYKRKWWVADKKSWRVSWEDLPHDSDKTVDGKAGGKWIEDFHYNNPGEFWLFVRLPNGTQSQYRVMMSDFDKDIVKRGAYEFWRVNMTLEEV